MFIFLSGLLQGLGGFAPFVTLAGATLATVGVAMFAVATIRTNVGFADTVEYPATFVNREFFATYTTPSADQAAQVVAITFSSDGTAQSGNVVVVLSQPVAALSPQLISVAAQDIARIDASLAAARARSAQASQEIVGKPDPQIVAAEAQLVPTPAPPTPTLPPGVTPSATSPPTVVPTPGGPSPTPGGPSPTPGGPTSTPGGPSPTADVLSPTLGEASPTPSGPTLIPTLAVVTLGPSPTEAAASPTAEAETSTPAPTGTLPPSATPAPTDTPQPTDTPEPTDTPVPATPVPTDTPAPTETSVPTDTPAPTATPAPTSTSGPTATLPPTVDAFATQFAVNAQATTVAGSATQTAVAATQTANAIATQTAEALPTDTPLPTSTPTATGATPVPSGHVSLSSGATAPLPFNVTNMAPGDSAHANLTIGNESNVNFIYSLTVSATSPSGLDQDPNNGLQLRVLRCDSTFSSCTQIDPDVPLYYGRLLVSDRYMGGPDTVGAGGSYRGLRPGSRDYLQLEVALPLLVGDQNALQSLTSVVEIKFTATQTT